MVLVGSRFLAFMVRLKDFIFHARNALGQGFVLLSAQTGPMVHSRMRMKSHPQLGCGCELNAASFTREQFADYEFSKDIVFFGVFWLPKSGSEIGANRRSKSKATPGFFILMNSAELEH